MTTQSKYTKFYVSCSFAGKLERYFSVAPFYGGDSFTSHFFHEHERHASVLKSVPIVVKAYAVDITKLIVQLHCSSNFMIVFTSLLPAKSKKYWLSVVHL